MDIYRERSHLLALLTLHYDADLYHDYSAEPGFGTVLALDLPTGQASWHLSDADLDLFAHVRTCAPKWDGHTTEEKYQRIRRLIGVGDQINGTEP